MASLLNPFGFGQKHAYFYVRLTIHELKNVPLISGEFQVKWRFKHHHPIADVPGISLAPHQHAHNNNSSSSSASSVANTDSAAAAAEAGPSSSSLASASASASTATPTWHQPHPEPRGETELIEVADHCVRWRRRVEVGLKMHVERASSAHHTSHSGGGGGGSASSTFTMGASGAATVPGSSAASIRSFGSAHRDRGDESRSSLKSSSSAVGFDSYSDHYDRRGGDESTHKMDSWGRLGRCELKLTVKQQIDTSSHSSHTMAPPVLGYVVLNLAEFAPHAHPGQANHYHHHHSMHHHHLFHHHHHHHHQSHHEIDPKQILYRTETRRFLLSESRTNASLTVTVETLHIGGTREYIVPTLRDGIIITSSDQRSADLPLLPFLHSRDDHSPGSAGIAVRDFKDRRDIDGRDAGDSSIDPQAGTFQQSAKQYAASIGGRPYRERANSSVSSFDSRSARSVTLNSTAEFGGLSAPPRAAKGLPGSAWARAGTGSPYGGLSGSRGVAGHSRIPSKNLRDPDALKNQKAKERGAAAKSSLLGLGEGTELSPDEIVRDLFRAEPKHLPVKREDRKDNLDARQADSRGRSGESSMRSSLDGRSLGADLHPGLQRRLSSGSNSSRSTDVPASERTSGHFTRGDDTASLGGRSSKSIAGLSMTFGKQSTSLEGLQSRSDGASLLSDRKGSADAESIHKVAKLKEERSLRSPSKGQTRAPSTTSAGTMRSLLSAKGLAGKLVKRQNSTGSKHKSSAPPTAVITRQTGPQHTPGLLNSQSPVDAAQSTGRSPAARGPSIRWNLGGIATSGLSQSSSFPGAMAGIDSATSPLDVVPTSSRVPGSERAPQAERPPNPPIVIRAASSDMKSPMLVEGDSPVSEVPSPTRSDDDAHSQMDNIAAALATMGHEGPAAPLPKPTLPATVHPDRRNWRGAGWRADIEVPTLDQDAYTRPAWPPILQPSLEADRWSAHGLPLKGRAGSMAIYRLNPKVSSPPEEGMGDVKPLSAAVSRAQPGNKFFTADPEERSDSIFHSTPAGVAQQLARDAGVDLGDGDGDGGGGGGKYDDDDDGSSSVLRALRSPSLEASSARSFLSAPDSETGPLSSSTGDNDEDG